MINQKKSLIVAISVIGAVLISLYFYTDLEAPIKDVQDGAAISINPGQKGEGYQVTIVEDEKIDKSDELKSVVIPNLTIPVVNYAKLEDSVFKIISQNIAILASDLAKDFRDQSKWLNLALFRKMTGDYQASVEILNYVAVVWPSDHVVYNNLADLYQYSIKNYPLAEKNWLKVIGLKPDYPEAYQNLFTLYSAGYKGKYEALPILLKGLSQNSHSTDLMVAIARYYKTTGDRSKASVYYNKAIDEAILQKNEQLEQSVRAELREMSQ